MTYNARSKLFVRAIPGFLLVTIWIGGLALYDSWLRPWPVILAWCGGVSVAILSLYLIFIRGYRALTCALLVLLIFLAIPLPSFVRKASFHNHTQATIAIQVFSSDGERYKQAKLTPGGTWNFVYFAGDKNGREAISAKLEITNLSSGASLKRQIDLPITSNGPTINVSEDWFNNKNMEL